MERISCTVKEACASSGLGRTKIYELIGNGSLKSVKIGNRTLINWRSLVDLLAVN